MALLKKLFGSKDPLTVLRRFANQHRWADLLRQAAEVQSEQLGPEDSEELQSLVELAGSFEYRHVT